MTKLEIAYALTGLAVGYVIGIALSEERRYYPRRSFSCWLRMAWARWRV